MSTINHGANLFDLEKKYGFKKEEMMDFSSNINPFGASQKALKAISENPQIVSIYPDPHYKILKESISHYSKSNIENIILGNGATSLISGFIKEVAPKNALVLSPAYSEYKKELEKIDSNIFELILKPEENFLTSSEEIIEKAKATESTLIVICNPNNPTGTILDRESIRKIAASINGYIMVDETYIEFTDKCLYSSSELCDEIPNLFVIRGTSKFFSTPGLRLGYGIISDKKIKSSLEKYTSLWGINIFADIMGSLMFTDELYQRDTYKNICEERTFLINSLSSFNDLKVYPSFGNFILCEIKTKKIKAKDLYKNLIKDKIIIRNCESFQGLSEYYFRVCTLKRQENEYLIDKLSLYLK